MKHVQDFGPINTLELPADKKVGKQVTFRNPRTAWHKKVFTVTAKQKVWGRDEHGRLNLVDGYRIGNSKNDYGVPAPASELILVRPKNT